MGLDTESTQEVSGRQDPLLRVPYYSFNTTMTDGNNVKETVFYTDSTDIYLI